MAEMKKIQILFSTIFANISWIISRTRKTHEIKVKEDFILNIFYFNFFPAKSSIKGEKPFKFKKSLDILIISWHFCKYFLNRESNEKN